MSARDAPVLWGAETAKAVENFRISGEPMPAPVIRWLGLIKAAAAEVNADLGLVDQRVAEEIAAAALDIAEGAHAEQFPVDVFQTGSGTSTNMNVNEVISTLTGGRAHPNDDVNAGQSSNDVVPSAVHLAVLELVGRELLPALESLEESFRSKSDEFGDVVKAGRTHLMDAVPVTLGQEFAAHSDQLRAAREGVVRTLPEVGRLPIGGTAVGNGLNTHPEFAELVRRRLGSHLPASTAEFVDAPGDHFAVQGARDAIAALSGSFKVVAVALTKICNDLRWMASGPRAGLAEITLPELQKGSSIMPGKVNPVVPEVVLQVAAQVIGNDTTITVAAMSGNFELNVMVPVIARNALESCKLLTTATRSLATCVDGVEANRASCLRGAERTLASATALNPEIGYGATERIVQRAARENRSLRDVAVDEGVDVDTVERALDLRRLAAGNTAGPSPQDVESSAPRGSDSLLDVLAESADAGFDAQMIAAQGGLVECVGCGVSSPSSAFEIGGYRRLEGASDPADMLIVVLVDCPACGRHGTLVLGYGPNATEQDVSVTAGLDLRGGPNP